MAAPPSRRRHFHVSCICPLQGLSRRFHRRRRDPTDMTRLIRKLSRVLRLRLRRRHLVWSAAVGVLLAIGYNATLPLLVSTSGVRATMERTLDGWSGGKSKING
ncbi:MAG: AsmA family protein, partial [Sinorhizobium fredii]|nr:AsmA family protein [Sinorhizobium fredii]